PELFLMEVPSANRAAAPQTFSRIMFSSLGEASELFGEAVSIGYTTKLTDRLTGHVFGLTETGFMDEAEGPAMLEAAPETEGDADFAAAGLSYRVADGWARAAPTRCCASAARWRAWRRPVCCRSAKRR